MAYAYKKVIQHKNVRYDYSLNRANSKESQILAFDTKNLSAQYKVVAAIDERTNQITYLVELPQKVKEAIERLVS